MPIGRHDLILMPDQMMLQIHESIGHPLSWTAFWETERELRRNVLCDCGHVWFVSVWFAVTQHYL